MYSRTPYLFSNWRDYLSAATTGILPSQALREAVAAGHVISSSPISDEQIQPSSLDLRLGPVAHRIRASFLPKPGSTIIEKLTESKLYDLDLSRPCVLERGCVYIAPLMEELRLPASYSGKANPKSSTGRIDVFTRLITEFGGDFETVPDGYKGRLYTEIVPRTFSIVVRQGDRLNQLRLRRGKPQPANAVLTRLHTEEVLVYKNDEAAAKPLIEDRSLWLSVDLSGEDDSGLIGYRARKNAPLIDLAEINHYEIADYWEPICRTKTQNLILDPREFYILASKEKVRIPPDYAAEMLPYDPSVGEFRIHYAGFFDPGFGYGADDIKGTHAVLEVRSHEVPFLLEDGQVVAALEYHQLLDVPDKIYGQGIGSSYQHQKLALSKHFRRL